MEPEKEIYLKQFIESVKMQTPAPVLAEADGILLSFNAKLKEVYLQYLGLKKRSANNDGDFVKLALSHLKKFKGNRKHEEFILFREFYYALEHPALDPALQDKMDKGIELLEKRIDYFCSYTRKGLPDINSSYETVIYKSLGKKQDTHPAEWQENNYLAVLLVKYLKNHGFNNYFFDMDKMINGEKIEDTVFKFCERTTVLLLLAQQEAFRDLDGETNWCFKEYAHYSTTHPKQRFQVFTVPDLVEPEDARDEIKEWYRFMTSAQGIKGRRLDFDLTPHEVRAFVNEMAAEIRKAKDDSFAELVYT